MCQSIAEGGRRCAAHTRPKYQEALMSGLSNCMPDYGSHGVTWSGYSPEVIAALMDASIDYASTPSGNDDVLKDIDKYKESSDFNMVVGILEVAQAKGLERLAEYKSVKEQVETLVKEPDATKVIVIATTLGAEVPAPVGTTLYQVNITTYYDEDSNTETIGVWPTEELAKDGLVVYIIRQWFELGLGAPWHDDHPDGHSFYLDDPKEQILWEKAKDNYLNKKSNDEIIEKYFSGFMTGTLDIKKLKIN